MSNKKDVHTKLKEDFQRQLDEAYIKGVKEGVSVSISTIENDNPELKDKFKKDTKKVIVDKCLMNSTTNKKTSTKDIVLSIEYINGNQYCIDDHGNIFDSNLKLIGIINRVVIPHKYHFFSDNYNKNYDEFMDSVAKCFKNDK